MVNSVARSLALGSLLTSWGCGDDIPPGQADGTEGRDPTAGSTTGPNDGGGSSAGTGPVDDENPLEPGQLEWPRLECDPLAPDYCSFPFPSNVFTVPEPSMATGRRVQLPTAPFVDGPNVEAWSWSDGFSPSAAIMTYLPGATAAGLPGHDDIDASLAADSPTVLLDAQSGERIPHFSELDHSANDPSRRALMIRPAARLPAGRRYIAAVRRIVDAQGQPLPPSPAFAALRDGTPQPEAPSVEARRSLYGDIFYRLTQAGIERGDLQLAWDFHTASDDNTTGWLLHMRDEAFAALDPDQSPPYTLDVVDTEWNSDQFLYRIEGTFVVPRYLDSDDPVTGRLVHGPDGTPVAQGMLEVPFWMIVPRSAEATPAPLMQHGHGLLGRGTQVENSHFRDFTSTYNYVAFAIDWMGMSEEDILPISATVSIADPTGLAVMTDRLHQGALNQLLAMRMAWAGLARDPLLTGLIDPSARYWYGISQGGILGGVYMATTTEVERGVLDVLGQPYNLLLTRSVDFDPFFDLMRAGYPDPLDIAQVLASLQMLWDRVEPTGYSHRIVDNPLPNTPAHQVLMTAALGDHQVTTLGAHHMARSAGIGHLETGLREIWGLPPVEDGHEGSALVEYDFGLPPDPFCNRPQSACEDPHGRLRRLDSARQQIDRFLREGRITNFCEGGECRYPELGECEPGATTPAVCE